MTTVQATLPYPPTANKLWRFVPGQRTPLKSEDYRRWLAAVDACLPMSMRGKVRGSCRVEIIAERPDARKRDLDNLVKPILDAIKDGKTLKGLIRDDADINAYAIQWAGKPSDRPASVHVIVRAD